MDRYLLSLCQDYVELVNRMRQGQYTPEEWQTLDRERQVAHRQLAEYAELREQDDAYAYARAVVLAARGGNYQ
ncbi:MAG: hypothetical protein EOM24_26775 [Chloroflexia bacterium]|nr:hypothetical protein [Chloroflexia bacterium]